MKISFDYDGTFNTAAGNALAERKRTEGHTIYIISARSNKSGIDGDFVPLSRIYATGSNQAKVAKVKELAIDIHYDNNPDVVSDLPGIGRIFNA